MGKRIKLLVAVKRVVDYNVMVRLKSDGTGVDTEGVRMSMNPFDEVALEEAVRIKEAGRAKEVIAVSLGDAGCVETLRSAIAVGADRGILVHSEQPLEPLAVAKLLQAVVGREHPDMVLLGKQAIDDDSNQTGQMLAAMLGWPQGTYVSEMELGDAEVTVRREIDGGTESLRLQLPAVITADLRLNEPRFASLPNIMRARKSELEVIQAETLNVDTAPRLTILQVTQPAPRKTGVQVDSATDLVARLRREAKAL